MAKERTIITKQQRLRNLEVIEKCKKGLFFVYIDRTYKTEFDESAGYGYATLVFDGVEVGLDGSTGKTLNELNDEKWQLDGITQTFEFYHRKNRQRGIEL